MKDAKINFISLLTITIAVISTYNTCPPALEHKIDQSNLQLQVHSMLSTREGGHCVFVTVLYTLGYSRLSLCDCA